MKYLKTCLAALLAAMALTAFAVPSASAVVTKICSTAGTGAACGAGHGNLYTAKTLTSTLVGTAKMVTTKGASEIVTTASCTGGSLKAEVNKPEGEPAEMKISELLLEPCSASFCANVVFASTATPGTPWSATVTTESFLSNTNGTMAVANVTVSVSGCLTSCTYASKNIAMKIEGSDTSPMLIATNQPLAKETGPLNPCGELADFTATFKITTPSSLFIE